MSNEISGVGDQLRKVNSNSTQIYLARKDTRKQSVDSTKLRLHYLLASINDANMSAFTMT